MSVLHWFTSLAALIGVWLNIHRRVECFWIWTFTNATWVYVDLTHGIPAQAALQGVYCILSLYGIWKWGSQRGDCK